MTPQQRAKECERLFSEWVDTQNYGHVIRLRDSQDLTGRNWGRTGKRGKAVDAGQLPSDFFWVMMDNNPCFLEIKSCMDETSFALSNIRPLQKGTARICEKYCDPNRPGYQLAIYAVAHKRWFLMEASWLFKLAEELGRKSVPWSKFKTGWDITDYGPAILH